MALERLMPAELKRRAEEAEEAPVYGDFFGFQEVAASKDLVFGDKTLVREGTLGVVISSLGLDDSRIIVKFDKREDDSETCVNVLPSGLRPGQAPSSTSQPGFGNGNQQEESVNTMENQSGVVASIVSC